MQSKDYRNHGNTLMQASIGVRGGHLIYMYIYIYLQMEYILFVSVWHSLCIGGTKKPVKCLSDVL